MAAKELIKSVIFNSANLKAYYRMESGALTTDSSASGYTLTNNNTVTNGTGVFGSCGDFELSSSQSLSIADASCPDLKISGSITCSAWINLESVGAGVQVVVGKVNGAGGYQIFLTNTYIQFYANSLTTNATVAKNMTVNTGTWYHLVGVYDSVAQKLSIYVNGEATTVTASGSISTPAAVFYIGRNDSGAYFDGLIDDVAIFNTALSADQIKELYEGRIVGEGWPQAGLVAGYHLNGNSTDFSGNNNHGTDTAVTYSLANGKFGQGGGFVAASSSKIVIPNLGNYAGLTLSAWVKKTSSAADFPIRAKNATDQMVYGFYTNATTATLAYLTTANTANANVTGPPLTQGVWYHLVSTYDGANLRFYMNGNSVGTPVAATGNVQTPTANHIGSYDGTTIYFAGSVDEVQIYNVAKDARWVRQQYALGRYGHI